MIKAVLRTENISLEVCLQFQRLSPCHDREHGGKRGTGAVAERERRRRGAGRGGGQPWVFET